jgi:hypothetical protein
MVRSQATLDSVSARVREAEAAREQLDIEALAWVKKQMLARQVQVEQAVMAALEDGHTVANVARAYTVSGLTPNRNAIYAIRKKYAEQPAVWVGGYPFEWTPRTVETAAGLKTVYDIEAEFSGFGPQEISGNYRWRFDVATGEPEQYLSDPQAYPIDNYYRRALEHWIGTNPYPGQE